MVRQRDDKEVPWTALVIGLWIPNFFYWGLNQYITQRTLGSKSLAEGQKGIVFAAFLKLIIPFIVVIPGILAYNLFHGQLKHDAVNRNALVLSEYSPELYRSLSDAMKPDRSQQRNHAIVAKIDQILSSGTWPPRPFVYKFDAAFASLHPQDAAAVVAHDLHQVQIELGRRKQVIEKLGLGSVPAENTSPEELARFSHRLADAVSERLADSVAVETLVAHDYDNAFPTLIRELVPIGNGIKGFVLAAIFGAVVSSIAMLNSASTIATMDLYHKLRQRAGQYELVTVGRVFVVLFVLIAILIAPNLAHPKFGGIFTYIQDFWGFITSGILAVFLFGVLVHRAPRACGIVGLLLNPVLYLIFKFAAPQMAFLNRQAICFGAIIAVLTAMTLLKPLPQPVNLPVNPAMNLTASQGAKVFGGFVICLTLALYVIFW
jgi:SSS family solute:Na+ symporter